MNQELIERLLVTVEGSSELLRQELQKGGQSVDQFARSTDQRLGKLDLTFNKVATSVRSALAAFGVGFGATALINFTRGAISAADAIGETARQAGFGAERFQRLQFVFRQNGTSAQEFDAAMRTLNTRLGQFIKTGAGPAAKAIEQLGLKQRIASGEIKTSEQLFDAVVDALGSVSSSAERAALAAAFFGREAGAKLADTLGRGTQAINEAAEAATGVFSDETVRKADALGDAWERIASAAGSWAKSVAVGVAHNIGQGLGIDELQENDASRLARLRDALRWNESGFMDTEANRRGIALLREQIAELERYEELLKSPFIQAGPQGAQGDGLQNIVVRSRQILGTANTARAAGMREFNPFRPDNGELQEIAGLPSRASNAGDIFAAERERRERLGGMRDMAPVTRQWEEASKRAEEYAEAVEKARERQRGLADAIAASFESRGMEALLNGRPRDAVRGLAKDFVELVLRIGILQPLAEKLANTMAGIGTSGGGGGGFASIFTTLFSGMGFASGGRPPVGKASWFGEKGPELWVPDVPGRIYSNAQSMRMAAGGGAVFNNTVNVNGSGQDASQTAAAVNRAMSDWSRRTTAHIQDLIRRGRFA